jgi:hypothetical protein
MAGIKAIETSYKGYRFRSRLEARWAVFFDALGIEWTYETQGYEKSFEDADLEGGTHVIRYLPDFHLPATQTWVEVKGSDDQLKEDSGWMEEFLDYGCPLTHFTDSSLRSPDTWNKCRGLLILGEVPDPTRWGLNVHRLIRHHKGLDYEWAYFGHGAAAGVMPVVLEGGMAEWFQTRDAPWWTTRSGFIPTHYAFTKVQEAYRAARSARFEHGESGARR